jgi:hypothetical protein
LKNGANQAELEADPGLLMPFSLKDMPWVLKLPARGLNRAFEGFLQSVCGLLKPPVSNQTPWHRSPKILPHI